MRRLLEPSPPLPPLSSNSPAEAGVNPSLMFIGGIVVFVFVVSISLHFLLRYFHRRCGSSDNGENDVEAPAPAVRSSGRRVAPEEVDSQPDHRNPLLESLPLFSYSEIRRSSSSSSSSASNSATAADCAVCLSKFEQHDMLRLLPLCCHAFHACCIDTWLLANNQTCPLCRSKIFVDESDLDGLVKRLGGSSSSSSSSTPSTTTAAPIGSSNDTNNQSIRIEIGSVSSTRRGVGSESEYSSDRRHRSYSLGSFEYAGVDGELRNGGSEIARESGGFGGKKSGEVAEVGGCGGGRGWLREYVDRIAASSTSSSAFSSLRLSGRFLAGSGRRTGDVFSGSSRRSEGIAAGSFDLDRNGLGEDIGNFFRWLSWV
ncbi:hypothetical protein Sjap_004704 [Stephania japonica]|uniref:RING-type domain-containing protein n=1 Tax=Stephania japonica TaxID=461633 RepID=A0AAP0K2Y0_9MAGN